MPRILENEAFALAQGIDSLDESQRPQALDILTRYRDQQNDLGEPEWPSQVQAQEDAQTRLRGMFSDIKSVDAAAPSLSALLPYSENPDADRARVANTAYLAHRYGKTADEISASYDLWKGDYATRHLNDSRPLDDLGFHAAIAKEIEGVKLKEATAIEGAKAAWRGDDVIPALQAWQAKNLDRMPDSTEFTKGFLSARERSGEHLEFADSLLGLLESSTGKSKQDGAQPSAPFTDAKAAEINGALEQLATMKPRDRKQIYTILGAKAEAAGYDQKGFWAQMLGEFDKGMARMGYSLGTGVPNLIEGGMSVEQGVASAVLGAVGADEVAGKFKAGSEMAKETIATRQGLNKVRNDLAKIVSGSIDPVKPVLGWMNDTLETGLIKGPGAVAPFMLVTASTGLLGGTAIMTADFAEQNRIDLIDQGMDNDQAAQIGAAAAPLQAITESLSNMLQLGRFPAVQRVLSSFTKPIGGGAGLAARYLQNSGLSLATEFTEEQLQDNFIVPASQELLGALQSDVPDVDWSMYRTRAIESTPELLSVLAPMALVFGGTMTAAQANLSSAAVSSQDMLEAAGYSAAQANAIRSQTAPEAQISKARELWGARAGTPQTIEAAAKTVGERMRMLQTDHVAAQKDLEQRGVLPRMLRSGDESWRLTFNDGSVADFNSHGEADSARWQWANDQLGKVHLATRSALAQLESGAAVGREFAVEFKPDAMTAQMAVDSGRADASQIQRRVQQGAAVGESGAETVDEAQAFTDAAAIDKATSDYLSSLQILGSSANEFKDGVLRTTIRLYEGAHVLTLVEEKLEGDAKQIVASKPGREWMLSKLREYERVSGDALFRKVENDAELQDDDLVEAWSSLGQSYLVGKSKKGAAIGKGGARRIFADVLKSGMGGALNAETQFFNAVWRRAAKLSKLKREGKLGDDLAEELERQLGIDSQAKHEATVTDALAAEMVDTSSYSEANPGPNGETFSVRKFPVPAGLAEAAQKARGESSLILAYQQAQRGSSSAMVPIKAVYDAAKKQAPALTPAAFMAQINALNDSGKVLIGLSETVPAVEAAGAFRVGGAGTEMAFAPSPETFSVRPMASEQGATQANTEPSPGGLSEAGVKLWDKLQDDFTASTLPSLDTEVEWSSPFKEAHQAFFNARYLLNEAAKIGRGESRVKPEFIAKYVAETVKRAAATLRDAQDKLKTAQVKTGQEEVGQGFRLLHKVTRTPWGSRYYDFDYKGQLWHVRIADHANTADRQGQDDFAVARYRTRSGMDFPHRINIVLSEPSKSDKESLKYAKDAVLKMLVSLKPQPSDAGSYFYLLGKGKNGEVMFDSDILDAVREDISEYRGDEKSQSRAESGSDMPGRGPTNLATTKTGQGDSPQSGNQVNPESSRAAGGTLSLRPGDFSSRMAAAFSPFQRSPELRMAIAQVAKARAQRLGAEWIEKAAALRSASSITGESRVREALAYEARMNEYLDGLTPNARQTLEFEPASLEDDPLIAAMLDHGKLMSRTTARKLGKVEAKSVDYDGAPWLPPAWYSKGAGIMPDQMAQAMHDAGLLPDAYTDTLWKAIASRIASTKKDKAAHREAVTAYKAAQKYARDASKAEAEQWAEKATKAAGSPKAQREALKAALRTLDGILSAAPPEVRAKVGGYVKLAGLATDEAMLREIEKRVAKLDVELSKWLKKEGIEAIEKLFKKAKADFTAGKKAKGKLGPDEHYLFQRAQEAAVMNSAQVLEALAVLDTRIASDELTPEQEALAILESGIIELVGDLKNADAGRVFSALDELQDLYDRGRLEWTAKLIKKREGRTALREALKADTGKTGVKKERQAMDKLMIGLVGKLKTGWLSLSSFHELLNYAFGSKSTQATALVDAERNASNDYEDGVQSLADEIESLFTTMAGGKVLDGERLRFDMAQRTIDAGTEQLSQLEAIQALLMWRQEDGRRHMEGARDEQGQVTSSWAYDQAWIDNVEDQLTQPARLVMAWIGNRYSGEHAELNALYRERHGVNLPQHDNYAPLTVKPVQVKAGEMTDPVSGAPMSGSILTPGSLRTRSRHAIAEPDFRDALQTLIGHKKQMGYWKAYYDLAVEAQAVLGNRDLMNSVHAAAGEEAVKMLRRWVDVISMGGTRDAAAGLALTEGLRRMTNRAATVGLLGRVSTLLVQSTQLAAASVKMPTGAYLKRFSKLITGNLSWGDAIKSPFIQRRVQSAPPIVRQAMESLGTATRPNQITRSTRWLGQLLSGADGLFTAGTYAILLDYHRETGAMMGLTGAELEAHAQAEAERATEQVAQPTRTTARSMMELASATPLAKVGWAYASEARQKFALAVWAASNIGKDKAYAGKVAFLVFVVGGILPALLKNLWKEAKGDDDEKKWGPERLAIGALANALHGVPMASELMGEGGMLSGAIWAAPALKDIAKGEGDMRDVETLLSTLGYFNDNAAGVAALSHAGFDFAKLIINLVED